jgi:hypothetical protein
MYISCNSEYFDFSIYLVSPQFGHFKSKPLCQTLQTDLPKTCDPAYHTMIEFGLVTLDGTSISQPAVPLHTSHLSLKFRHSEDSHWRLMEPLSTHLRKAWL